MENNYKNIDKLFRDSIESYEMQPSNKVWESLDNKLDKKAANKYKAIAIRLRITIAILVILFLGIGVYFFNISKITFSNLAESNQNKTSNMIASNSTKKENIVVNQIKPEIKAYSIDITNPNKTQKPNIIVSNNFGSSLKQNIKIPQTDKYSKQEYDKLVGTNKENKDSEVIRDTTNQNENNTLNITKKDTITSTELSPNLYSDSSVSNRNVILAINDSTLITITNLSTGDSISNLTIQKSNELSARSKFRNQLSVLGYFSPDFTKKYVVDANKNYNQTQSEYEGKEIPEFSFNTGLLIGYDLTPKWTIKTGVLYAYLMQSIKPKTVYAQTGLDGQQHYQFNTSYGNAQIANDASPMLKNGDSLKINSTSTQLLQMISVPVIAKYQIQRNKFTYYAQFGFSINFLISEKLLVETPNRLETITNIEGLKKFNFGGIIGCGVSYSPIKKLSIMLEPTFRGFLSPINQNNTVKSYPYSLGLSVGLGWHL